MLSCLYVQGLTLLAFKGVKVMMLSLVLAVAYKQLQSVSSTSVALTLQNDICIMERLAESHLMSPSTGARQEVPAGHIIVRAECSCYIARRLLQQQCCRRSSHVHATQVESKTEFSFEAVACIQYMQLTGC